MIHITIPGEPKALKRHRGFIRGNTIVNYDPSSSDKNNFLIKSLNKRPEKPFEGAISLELHLYFQRPKSHYGTGKNKGKLKPNAPVLHTKRPDASNILKFVEDAYNKIFFRDDSQICSIFIKKEYSESPRTEIIICEI